MDDHIDQYVIYDHPSDDPDHFVVRRWAITAACVTPLESTAVDSIDAARRVIQDLAPGSVCVGRQLLDDPVIVESWL